VKVQADANFTGPPSALAYFWLGNSPPSLEFHTCDASGNPTNVFYLGESVFARASGLPPGINLSIKLDSTESSLAIPLNTGLGGSFLAEVLASVADEDEYTVWLDVNDNDVMDGNDIQTSHPLSIKSRPSISVDSLTVDRNRAKQGEVVHLEADVSNHGSREEEIRVEFYYGQALIDYLSISLHANRTEKVDLDWRTVSFETGRRTISVIALFLPGENETHDNRVEGASITIESPPDISIESITPESRALKKGDPLRVQVKLNNRAPIQQVFELELLWTDEVVSTQTISLAGKTMIIVTLTWVTDEVGEGRIRVRTSTIPYEINKADNDLAAGQVTILPPNISPTSLASGPTETLVGLSSQFRASESSDPDGEIVDYRWDFGDGTTDFGSVVNHAFQGTGTYQINLTVTDDDGKSSSNITSIEVLDPSGFLFWASDQNGGAISEASIGEGIYATIVSPGSFSCQLHVIISGTATEGQPLIDLRGNPTTIHMENSVTTLVWAPTSSGLYDLVLDLDREGIYGTEYDLIHPAILVVDQAYLLAGIILVIAVLRREMGEC
jgi:PKD repeat protein